MDKERFEIIKHNCTVFAPKSFNPDSDVKDVLCIVPNLSLNGAQTVLREMLHLISRITPCRFFVLSPSDGEYRDIYNSDGMVVCIRPYVSANINLRKAIQTGFNAVIMNTALVHPYVLFFVNLDIPVLWWIHEGADHMRDQCADMPNPYLLSPNIKIYSVTDRVDQAFKELYEYKTEVLHMSIEDCSKDYLPGNKDDRKVIFVIPGAYTPIKGQDILLQAISQLPQEYRDKAKFLFCGYKLDNNEEYYDMIMRISERLDCVTHLGQLSKNEMYQLYSDCDCVIAPSRIDSTPTTIVEAMMFGKLTIASVNCGITAYMTDCVNGFVFDSVDELVKRLLLVVSDAESLRNIGERGREIWAREFSPQKVENIIRQSGILE